MTDYEAIELGNKLYANITSNANNIIKTNDYINFVRMAINTLELKAKICHCKECIHWVNGVAGCTEYVKLCNIGKYMVGENGYCVYGEKKK